MTNPTVDLTSPLLRATFALVAPFLVASCPARAPSSDPPDVVVVALPLLDPPIEPRRNMVWIPPGTFIAGTPIDRVPRVADAELLGVPITLRGFYIDQYPEPNDPGAIQTAGLTRDEAQQRCEEQSKRLCTELEWERACKGANSTTYEYGNMYRADECGSGANGLILPIGSRVGCRSSFDIHDMHGGAFEWTASAWGRGDPRPMVAIRGGAGSPGELMGRCANGQPSRADVRRPNLGFRCCAGEPNDAIVEIDVVMSKDPLVTIPFDRAMASDIESSFGMTSGGVTRPPTNSLAGLKVDRLWRWQPVGNEPLVVGAGCAHAPPTIACGVVVVRIKDSIQRAQEMAPTHEVLCVGSSGRWVPIIRADDDPKLLWLYGVDEAGQFQRRIEYRWGRVVAGEPERAWDRRKKKKGKD